MKDIHFIVIGHLCDRDNETWEGKAEDVSEAKDIFRKNLELDEDRPVELDEIIFEAVVSSESPITLHEE